MKMIAILTFLQELYSFAKNFSIGTARISILTAHLLPQNKEHFSHSFYKAAGLRKELEEDPLMIATKHQTHYCFTSGVLEKKCTNVIQPCKVLCQHHCHAVLEGPRYNRICTGNLSLPCHFCVWVCPLNVGAFQHASADLFPLIGYPDLTQTIFDSSLPTLLLCLVEIGTESS